MTDTSYDLCPTCGREEIADICPACCGVEQQIDMLMDEIMGACREKIARADKFANAVAISNRGREDRRQEIADLSWTLANLRTIKRQIGA